MREFGTPRRLIDAVGDSTHNSARLWSFYAADR